MIEMSSLPSKGKGRIGICAGKQYFASERMERSKLAPIRCWEGICSDPSHEYRPDYVQEDSG
jgi:hypothetical protein